MPHAGSTAWGSCKALGVPRMTSVNDKDVLQLTDIGLRPLKRSDLARFGVAPEEAIRAVAIDFPLDAILGADGKGYHFNGAGIVWDKNPDEGPGFVSDW